MFAEADEVNWQLQFTVDADECSTAAATVELSDDQPCEREGFVKDARLLNRVGAKTTVDDQPTVVWRCGVLFLDDAF